MSKRNQSSGTKSCTCDKCLAECNSTVAGTRHRNCPGIPNQPNRSHDNRLPTADRGKWS